MTAFRIPVVLPIAVAHLISQSSADGKKSREARFPLHGLVDGEPCCTKRRLHAWICGWNLASSQLPHPPRSAQPTSSHPPTEQITKPSVLPGKSALVRVALEIGERGSPRTVSHPRVLDRVRRARRKHMVRSAHKNHTRQKQSFLVGARKLTLQYKSILRAFLEWIDPIFSERSMAIPAYHVGPFPRPKPSRPPGARPRRAILDSMEDAHART